MTSTTSTERIPEIDWLKGFAILCVVANHANLFDSTLQTAIINRGVAIFLVLFGVSSALWWKRAAALSTRARLARWYRERLWSLLLPVWAAATLWWMVALAEGVVTAQGLGWQQVLLTYLGYSPWIGISWFVTIILQLVLFFPLLHWISERLGVATLLLAAALSLLSVFHLWDILEAGKVLPGKVPEPGWYYYWIFAPRVLWHVTAGIFIARAGAQPGRQTTVVAIVLFVLLVSLEGVAMRSVDDPYAGVLRKNAVECLADVPATVALLGMFRWLRPLPRITRFLAYCGAASWGIYLGHMLVHEFVHMEGMSPETGPQLGRFLYATALFVGGAGLMICGHALRQRLQLRSTGRLSIAS